MILSSPCSLFKRLGSILGALFVISNTPLIDKHGYGDVSYAASADWPAEFQSSLPDPKYEIAKSATRQITPSLEMLCLALAPAETLGLNKPC